MRCAAVLDLLERARAALRAGRHAEAEAHVAAAMALAPYIAMEALK